MTAILIGGGGEGKEDICSPRACPAIESQPALGKAALKTLALETLTRRLLTWPRA